MNDTPQNSDSHSPDPVESIDNEKTINNNSNITRIDYRIILFDAMVFLLLVQCGLEFINGSNHFLTRLSCLSFMGNLCLAILIHRTKSRVARNLRVVTEHEDNIWLEGFFIDNCIAVGLFIHMSISLFNHFLFR